MRGEAIRARLEEFARIPAGAYFYELVYCLLTPQSSAVNAGRVVELLEEGDALHREMPFAEILHRKEHYIRFHNTKAERIRKVRSQMPAIQEAIQFASLNWSQPRTTPASRREP